MNHYQVGCGIATVCLFFAFSSAAHAQTVQCISQQGHTTYTDMPCAIGQATAQLANPNDKPKALTRAGFSAINFANAERARAAAWSAKRTSDGRLSADKVTMKAAKDALELSDYESTLLRQQLLAQR